MLRKIEEKDRELFISYCKDFYSSEAVLHPVPESHHEITFDELMRSDTYALGYIITDSGKDIGYLLLSKTFSQEAGGIVLWIEEIYVEEEYRGKGIGGAIFDYIDQSIPYARLRLEVEPDNEGALKLYKRKGFRELPYLQMIKGK